MVIQSLINFYDRLVSEGVDIPKYGWCKLRVDYAVHLNKNGSVKKIESLAQEKELPVKGGKTKTVTFSPDMDVPLHSTRTSGFHPFPYCDTAAYLFGLGKDKSEREVKIGQNKFLASKDKMGEILADANSEAAQAMLNFFDAWDYENVYKSPLMKLDSATFMTGNFLFYYDGAPVTEDADCIRCWNAYINEHGFSGSEKVATDVVTGERGTICRVHPKIKKVPTIGGTGAPLCCSNNASSDFNGEKQGYSFPMTEANVFKYTTALNYLASCRGTHCYTESLGNVTVIYWSETASEQQDKTMNSLLSVDIPEDAPEFKNKDYVTFIRRTCDGYLGDVNSVEDPDNPKYTVIGLDSRDGFVARIKWILEGTLRDFASSVIKHYEDTTIDGCQFSATPFRILSDCMPHKGDGTIKNDARKPSNALLDSIVNNKPYPKPLIESVIRRIIIESGNSGGKSITPIRAAFLKGVLIRNYGKEISVSVNVEETNPAYLMGRALCIAERTQYKAMNDKNHQVNTDLSTRFLSTLLSHPSTTMTEIVKKNNYYLKKLHNRHSPAEISCAREWDAVMALFPAAPWPNKLSGEERALVCLGYYQEREAFFAKAKAAKETKEAEENAGSNNDAA